MGHLDVNLLVFLVHPTVPYYYHSTVNCLYDAQNNDFLTYANCVGEIRCNIRHAVMLCRLYSQVLVLSFFSIIMILKTPDTHFFSSCYRDHIAKLRLHLLIDHRLRFF